MVRAMLVPALWMALVMTGAAGDNPVAATVTYTYFTPAFDPPPLKMGDECFVPAKHAQRLGWVCMVKGEQVFLKVHGKPIETFVRKIGGENYLPLRSIIASAGGITEWDGASLKVYSRVTAIAGSAGAVEIRATLPLRPAAFVVKSPTRVVTDLQGARIDEATQASGRLRYSQFNKDVVRIVTQVSGDPQISLMNPAPAELFQVTWSGAEAVELEPLPGQAVDPIKEPEIIPASSPRTYATMVGRPVLVKDTAKETIVRIPVSGAAPMKVTADRDGDGVYWVRIPSAAISGEVGELKGSAIKSALLAANDIGGTDLRMELERPMGISVSPSASEVLIRLVEPRNAGGKLSSKKIVIDAGHGGSDSGARSGSVLEKSLTLPIAKMVAEGLSEHGVTVLMTRNGDTYPSLTDRAELANANNADFFISIHINSNGVQNSKSGTYVYYHFDDPDCRLLAQCIVAEIGKVTGLPNNGAISDKTVAPTKGFSVLRNSTMPGVLVEVAYINHSKDRTFLQREDFRKKVADAIIRGVKVYIGDTKN